MRANLNLLPDEKKKEIEKKKTLRLISYQGFLLFSILAFFSVILININLILRIQLKAAEELLLKNQDTGANVEINDYESKFKEINSRVANLSQINNKNIRWSSLFIKLSQITPDEIYILDLATKDYQVMISGKAQDRDDLIRFKDNLSRESCFYNVTVPLSNLVTKDNLDFQVDFKIKSECLGNE